MRVPGMPSCTSSKAVRRDPWLYGRVSVHTARSSAPSECRLRMTPSAVPYAAQARLPVLQWVSTRRPLPCRCLAPAHARPAGWRPPHGARSSCWSPRPRGASSRPRRPPRPPQRQRSPPPRSGGRGHGLELVGCVRQVDSRRAARHQVVHLAGHEARHGLGGPQVRRVLELHGQGQGGEMAMAGAPRTTMSLIACHAAWQSGMSR